MDAPFTCSVPRAALTSPSARFSVGSALAAGKLFLRGLHAWRPLCALAALLSRCVGRPVGPRRALAVVHAQTAWFSVLALGGSSLVLGVLLMGWAALSLWLCRAVR